MRTVYLHQLAQQSVFSQGNELVKVKSCPDTGGIGGGFGMASPLSRASFKGEGSVRTRSPFFESTTIRNSSRSGVFAFSAGTSCVSGAVFRAKARQCSR